ncbi:unnamed protein product [Paramecium octaurelia]|uniref:Pre-mRNA-splicing factor SYF1 n=1 Tax=Paramecium octaurelia TaxID=43137 RepID=A0A8S1THQ5_PAROT|nr:unnamed protein product [Paramecium octaurelia]
MNAQLLHYKLEQLEVKGSSKFEVVFAAPDTQQEQYSRFTLRAWWIVLQAHRDKPYATRIDLYERAFKYIPNCYKLWFNYLKEQLEDLGGRSTFLSNKFEEMISYFERALVYMHKMPNIWLMYAEYSASLQKYTHTRNVYDRALQSLPVTQHHRIWKAYCQWISKTESIKTAISIYNRYIKINPDYKEEYLDYLVSKQLWGNACQILVDILNDDQFNSSSGKTKYDFMKYLCEIIARHPNDLPIDAASIMKFGIKKYSDEIGQLWIKLADYYIKTGQFEQARDTFEDAVNNVLTVKDFSLVFNAYVKYEETIIQMLEDFDENDENHDDIDDTILSTKLDQLLKLKPSQDDEVQIEDELLLKMDRLDELLERRPILLNSCILRQNKYNVEEWLKRIELVKRDERMALKTFTEALEIVEPNLADNGKLSDIWIAYAKYYRDKGDWKTCNQIFYKGSKIEFKNIEEHVNLWSQWVEILLLDGFVNDSLSVIKQGLFKKYIKKLDKMTPSEMVPYSLQLWQLYLDLERNFGNFKSLRAAYKRMVELKVVTPFIIINYAQLLEDNAFYEESFKVFEAGVQLFDWPALYDLWIVYITKFIQRYRGQKIERTRNLFETVIEQVPKDKNRIFYLMYGEFEEQYGLLNHAIEIYDRMVFNVEYQDKMEAYNIYIAKVALYLGITKTRPVFESAIENLQEAELIQMGLRLAQLERKFGEIDRARAVYIHISQFSDPRFDDFGLWKTWENFELHHGNEDTYKEFRRISKSVVAKFSLMPPDPKKIKERVEKGQLGQQ